MAAPCPLAGRSYEERPCPWCHRGEVHADSFTARMVACTECGGTGRTLIYLYPGKPGRTAGEETPGR